MDHISTIFLSEAMAEIKQMSDQIQQNGFVGSFSSAVYDTAWLAMIRRDESNSAWLFPESFDYLLRTQNGDGGWPAYASKMDGILNTMAATIALKKHTSLSEPDCTSVQNDLTLRISNAEKHLRAKLRTWDVLATVHVGFEILVPTLLELLETDSERFEFPGRHALMILNQTKLSKFHPETLYSGRQTTLIHSLEAFVGKIDFDRVSQHLDGRGSMMASPAATAAYLMHCSRWDESAEKYLRQVIALGSGKGDGGVPSAFPSSIYEAAWITSTLLKSVLSLKELGGEEARTIGVFLHSQLEEHGGIVGFDSGLLADADDTAKTVLTTNLLGLSTSPERLVEEFEAAHHFSTYKGERNESWSANCNVLDTLLHSPNPADYCKSISKVSRFLCEVWYSGRVQDKWNLSEQYPMMLLSQSFIKLLQLWDSGQLVSLPSDLVHDQVPLVLFQILVRTLQKQSSDGSWGYQAPSTEVTAYAVLILKTLSSLPWLAHFKPRIQTAIKKGTAFLIINHDDWHHGEHIWVEKVTYALPPLSRAYCIAALCACNSTTWSDKVSKLVNISSEKTVELAKFFSRLPIFSADESWLLEADVAVGQLYLPQLMRVSSSIFSRQEKINYRYLEYIPFTWIATNRRNGSPLCNNTLWETMTIALLDYQLDEFMETVFDKDGRMANVEAVKSTVRRLCDFSDHGESKTNGYPSGHVDNVVNGLSNSSVDGHVETSLNSTPNGAGPTALEQVELTLSRFTSYVLQHPKVVQSPEHVRRHLHQELETCMLTHIEHDEDNARFAAQQQHAAALTKPSSGSLPAANDKILPFNTPRGTYYSWIRTTSADNTHCPFTFLFFACLAAPTPGEPFFQGVRQHYLSNALCRHLANLCRQYNDYGSVARDQAESNLNSINFPEFHEPAERLPGGGEDGLAAIRDERAMKEDLYYIAEYERECLEHAAGRLNAEMMNSKGGAWKTKALGAFVDTVDLYGQIYVARDITDRVR